MCIDCGLIFCHCITPRTIIIVVLTTYMVKLGSVLNSLNIIIIYSFDLVNVCSRDLLKSCLIPCAMMNSGIRVHPRQ